MRMMALQIRKSDEEEEANIPFLYRIIRINLNKVPLEYKDDAYTSMLFQGMTMINEKQSRGFIYRCLSNKAIDWYRLSKRRKELNKVYHKKLKMEEEFEDIDLKSEDKTRNMASCVMRVYKCATESQKRVIKDLLRFIHNNHNKQWDMKGASIRLGISRKRMSKVVGEIRVMFNSLYKLKEGDDEKTVAELYNYVRYKK